MVWPHKQTSFNRRVLFSYINRIHSTVFNRQTPWLLLLIIFFSEGLPSNSMLRRWQSVGHWQLTTEALFDDPLRLGWEPVLRCIIHGARLGTVHALVQRASPEGLVEVADRFVLCAIVHNEPTKVLDNIGISPCAITIVSQGCWLFPIRRHYMSVLEFSSFRWIYWLLKANLERHHHKVTSTYLGDMTLLNWAWFTKSCDGCNFDWYPVAGIVCPSNGRRPPLFVIMYESHPHP